MVTRHSLSAPASREEDGQWKEDQKLEAHSDWVRDVGWAPSIGLPTSTIASCSQVSVVSLGHAQRFIKVTRLDWNGPFCLGRFLTE